MERGRDVAGQFKLRPIVLVYVSRNGIDMDKMTLASLVPETWFVFDLDVSHGDDHISRVQELVGWLIVEQTNATGKAVEEFARHNPSPLVGAHPPAV